MNSFDFGLPSLTWEGREVVETHVLSVRTETFGFYFKIP